MAKINNINIDLIKNATPDSLKPSGVAKLGSLINEQNTKIQTLLQPNLDALLNKLNPPSGTCLADNELNKVIEQRNLLIGQLNNISNKLNNITTTLTGLVDFTNFLQNSLTVITSIQQGLIIAENLLPPLILPGAVPAAISVIENVKNSLVFSPTGTPKIEKALSSISTASLSVSLIGNSILGLVNKLKSLDSKIIECSNQLNPVLTPISKNIEDIVLSQTQSIKTQNQSTYNGFIIEIEEVPYTPTVTRKRAVGKNAQGISLIQTELSFTTNNQTLINELKLIIDRDNLKAY
jgi:hypothetical protein